MFWGQAKSVSYSGVFLVVFFFLGGGGGGGYFSCGISFLAACFSLLAIVKFGW